MKLIPIESGNFKLDGGAMFGVVPKLLWQKQYPADQNNLCELSLRCLLIDNGEKKILIDTGLGDKQNDKFFGYLNLFGDDSLDKSLQKAGYKNTDITDLILTHLHFDHCGGAVRKTKRGNNFELSFPNATHHICKQQWDWALNPNRREKASFIIENIQPIADSGKLNLYNDNKNGLIELLPDVKIKIVNGHTQGQAIPFINYKGRTVVYTADFIPLAASIPIVWIAGYDTQPLISFQEKEEFLYEAADNNYILFFEHDINVECCTVERYSKGVRLKKTFKMNCEL